MELNATSVCSVDIQTERVGTMQNYSNIKEEVVNSLNNCVLGNDENMMFGSAHNYICIYIGYTHVAMFIR